MEGATSEDKPDGLKELRSEDLKGNLSKQVTINNHLKHGLYGLRSEWLPAGRVMPITVPPENGPPDRYRQRFFRFRSPGSVTGDQNAAVSYPPRPEMVTLLEKHSLSAEIEVILLHRSQSKSNCKVGCLYVWLYLLVDC